MKKFHILIDMDGVTCDLQTPWYDWINKTFEDSLKREDVLSWDLHKYTKAGEACYDYLRLPGTFRNLKPMPGATYAIEKLIKQGHKVQFCTTPPDNCPEAEADKVAWLDHHFKEWFKPSKDVVFARDKSIVPGDILFDDRALHLWEYPGISIAMDQPYNQSWKGYRVNAWKEFTAKIKQLSEILK